MRDIIILHSFGSDCILPSKSQLWRWQLQRSRNTRWTPYDQVISVIRAWFLCSIKVRIQVCFNLQRGALVSSKTQLWQSRRNAKTMTARESVPASSEWTWKTTKWICIPFKLRIVYSQIEARCISRFFLWFVFWIAIVIFFIFFTLVDVLHAWKELSSESYGLVIVYVANLYSRSPRKSRCWNDISFRNFRLIEEHLCDRNCRRNHRLPSLTASHLISPIQNRSLRFILMLAYTLI